MGAAYAFIVIYQFDCLGAGTSARHSGVGGIFSHGLADHQRRMASSFAVGLDRVLFRLAIHAVQPNHALSIAGLSAVGDDGGLGRVRDCKLEGWKV